MRYTMMKGKEKMNFKVAMTYISINIKKLAKLMMYREEHNNNDPSPRHRTQVCMA